MKRYRNYFALLAAIWALLFGAVHFFWAMGIFIGLPEQQAKHAFERNWFQVYNLVAAFLCIVAFFLATALYRNKGSGNRVIRFVLFCCAAILTVRGLAALLFWVYDRFTREFQTTTVNFWDYWFLLGGGLFFMSAWNIKFGKFFGEDIRKKS